MIELLACKLGRNDEEPNIELAEKLCNGKDKKGIREIAGGLESKEEAVVNDCIKVLYEIGKRKPELISGFAGDFITALSGRNNRLVWGSMMALAYIAPLEPDAIFNRLAEIIAAYKKGSVITVDNSISVFAELCKAKAECRKKVFPLLLGHLQKCRPKEVPQHAERIAVCIDSSNRQTFAEALDARAGEFTEAQKRRIQALKKKLDRV